MSEIPEIRVGLVFGAGGPTGGPFIHAALGELARHTGWTAPAATSIVGTSAGAFVAAAVDPTPLATTHEQLRAFADLDNGQDFAAGLHHVAVARVRLVVGSAIARFAPKARPIAAYDVAAAPYHQGASVVTVQRSTARRRIHRLSSGTNVRAVVRASAAIPWVNGPIDVTGALHVDGALHSVANADVVDIEDHDALIVIAPMVPRAGGSVAERTHRAQLRAELAPWLRTEKPTIVITPNEIEHRDRRNRKLFELAGEHAMKRLTSSGDL